MIRPRQSILALISLLFGTSVATSAAFRTRSFLKRSETRSPFETFPVNDANPSLAALSVRGGDCSYMNAESVSLLLLLSSAVSGIALYLLDSDTVSKLLGKPLDSTTIRTSKGVAGSDSTTLLATFLPFLIPNVEPLHAVAYSVIPRLITMVGLLSFPDPTGGLDASLLVPIYGILFALAAGIIAKPSLAVLLAKVTAGVYFSAGIPLHLAPKTMAKALADQDLFQSGKEQHLGILLEQARADVLSGIAILAVALGKDVHGVLGMVCLGWIASTIVVEGLHKNSFQNLGKPFLLLSFQVLLVAVGAWNLVLSKW